MTHAPALTIASHYQHLQLVWSKLTRQPPAPAGASCRGQRICLGPVLSSEGCFSTVYGGTLVHTGAPVAVKRVELGEAGGSPTRLRREQQMRREIRNLSSLDHANIVALLDVVEDDTSISLVLERCWGGELYTFINSLTFDGRRTRLWQDEPADSAQPPLEAVAVTEAQIARIVRQILLALDFMHSHDVVHRDLKPENLMLLLPFAENQEPVIKVLAPQPPRAMRRDPIPVALPAALRAVLPDADKYSRFLSSSWWISALASICRRTRAPIPSAGPRFI
jgi:hypothetical protein